MLLYQAVRGFELWFGQRPEVTPELRAEVEADLTAAYLADRLTVT
jgi:shikimate dehydrogenase